jgi:hypothetical protein
MNAAKDRSRAQQNVKETFRFQSPQIEVSAAITHHRKRDVMNQFTRADQFYL